MPALARLLTAGAAVAALAVQPAVSAPAPQGILAASGRGVFILDGDAAVLGVARGPALIVVQDRAGDAMLRVGGRVVRPVRTRPGSPFVTIRRIRLGDVRRRFLVSGSDIRLRVESADMTLNASGRFRVRLTGQGSYTVDDGAPQAWVAGATVKVGLARQRRRG